MMPRAAVVSISGIFLCPRFAGLKSETIDPIPDAMLASSYGVSPASLLSLRPTFRRVSRDTLRYS
jgi:hypothetical protein